MDPHIIDTAGTLTPTTPPDPPSLWYLLPTYHNSVTPHHSLLSNPTFSPVPVFITPGSGPPLLSIATGTVTLAIGGNAFVLNNVHHVPGAQRNVFGGEHVVQETGGRMEYREGETCMLRDRSGRPVLKGMWDGRGWRVRTAVPGMRVEEGEEGGGEVVEEDEFDRLQREGKVPREEEGAKGAV